MTNLLWERLGLGKRSFSLLFFFSFFLFFPSLKSSETGSEAVPNNLVEKNDKNDKNELQTDFESIKDLLKNDFLDEEVKKRQQVVVQEKKKAQELERERYRIPDKNVFWPFISQLWLVKNAPLLKWDFEKPDYGLGESFQDLLESLGYFDQNFLILLLDSPNITHFALPSNSETTILLLSLPFIRSMDLSKLEISLLLLEDFFRFKAGYFENYVKDKNFEKELGSNFSGRELNFSPITKMLENYSYFIFEKGFSFQQQYEITTKMGNLLKSNLSLWQSYLGLLGKIDSLIKTNTLYKDYTKIYPSPELQIQWLTPEKKLL